MSKDAVDDDDYLVKSAQEGCVGAYNLLLERYEVKIQQTLYFYLKDSSVVKDLTQDVLLKVFRHLHYFKDECKFSTWLHRIILNTLKNHFRTISSQVESEAQFSCDNLVSTSLSPEHQLISSELGQQVEAALSRLSDDLKLCYGMHILEGHSYDEIAKAINCPIGTVRSRIFRARKLMVSYVDYNTLSNC